MGNDGPSDDNGTHAGHLLCGVVRSHPSSNNTNMRGDHRATVPIIVIATTIIVVTNVVSRSSSHPRRGRTRGHMCSKPMEEHGTQ